MISLGAGAKGVLLPFDGDRAVRFLVDTKHIESQCVQTEAFVCGNKHRRGARQFSLLPIVHGQCGTDEAAATALPNFDEHEDRAVEHNEVYFAAATAVIPLHEAQSVAAEETASGFFAVAPA